MRDYASDETQDTKEIKMDPITLAQEIIDGRRITRDDDLSFFLTCDLDELGRGADMIREKFIGDKVDLCSIINGRSGKCPEDCKYCAQICASSSPNLIISLSLLPLCDFVVPLRYAALLN